MSANSNQPEPQEFGLGEKVADTVTGFEGIITSFLISMEEPTLFLIESPDKTRWLPASRITTRQEALTT